MKSTNWKDTNNMRTRRTFCLLLAFPALAHDPSKHKGRPNQGEVVALAANGIQMKTRAGMLQVTFRDTTKFEQGDQKATRDQLKPGTRLTVFGTKLPTGELVAREVLIHQALPKKK